MNYIPKINQSRARAEANSGFPYNNFGATGGYGSIRRALLNAINSNQWELANKLYQDLFFDGFTDYLADNEGENNLPSMTEFYNDLIQYEFTYPPQYS